MFLSVIIPCYNVAKTVARTFNSIQFQTFTDYEIIFVNDGSTDNTFEILDNIEKQYINVTLINKNNGGVSAARNVGINHAKGDYIFFLDADDLIEPNLFKRIYENKDKDIIIWGFDQIWPNKRRVFKPIITNDIILDYFYLNIRIPIWGMAISRNLIIRNKILFDVHTSYGEDREFVVKVLLIAKKIGIITEVLFHYVYNSNSVTNASVFTLKRFSSIEASYRTYSNLMNSKYADAAYFDYLLTLLKMYALYLKGNPNVDFFNIFKKYFSQIHAPKIIKNKYVIIVYIILKVRILNKKIFSYLLKQFL